MPKPEVPMSQAMLEELGFGAVCGVCTGVAAKKIGIQMAYYGGLAFGSLQARKNVTATPRTDYVTLCASPLSAFHSVPGPFRQGNRD
jgi:uncharacterized membrane protein (Fun14 family)